MRADDWHGRRCLVTGHTGFKGAWLTAWLLERGAIVSGLSLPPASEPNLFALLGIGDRAATSRLGDIRDARMVSDLLVETEPEVVFHLAAQALVRPSYRDPVETFSTNVGGTVAVLDAVRRTPSVRAAIVVTSDKCYENREWAWGYRETDHLGGRDPYSASKGCAEIAASSMQRSYFAPFAPDGHPARIATVRAGNVIGGGDWSQDRLVPDIVRGCLGAEGKVHLRNPGAVRPWQHVLDPLAAYLQLAERLLVAPDGFDESWNIGPETGESRAVGDVAAAMIAALGAGRIVTDDAAGHPHEARLLSLDCAKARTKLGWRSRLSLEEAIAYTAEWYRAWHRGADMAAFTRRQIEAFASLERPRREQSGAGGPAR